MDDHLSDDDANEHIEALATWGGEGGAGVLGPQEGLSQLRPSMERSPDEDVVKLHGRIVALENLVFQLLADTTPARRRLARYMAADILRRPGRTRYPLTIHAAARMNSLVERAERRDATIAQKIQESETEQTISSDLQYATAAWHNKLKAWREDLDRLMAEYSPEFGRAHIMTLGEARYSEGSERHVI